MFPARFVTFALAMLIMAGMLSGCGQQVADITFTTTSSEARALFIEGLDKFDFLLFDDAREFFAKAVEADPDFAMAYYYWALTATTTSDFQNRLDKAVELAENVSEPEKLVIMSLKANNDDNVALARQHFEELVRLLPEGKRAHYFFGNFYYGQQEWASAEGEYEKVIGIDPQFAPVYNQLGYLYSNLARYEEAIEALTKYSQLRPEDPNPHDSMGEIYLWMGDHENSMKEYNNSLELDPDFVVSLAGLGHNRVFMGEFDNARAEYARILERAKSVADSNTAYFWEAMSYVHEKKRDKAIEFLKKQLDFAKAHNDIYLQGNIYGQIAVIYREKGDFEKALANAGQMRDIAMQPEVEPGPREGYIRFAALTEGIIAARQGKQEMANSKLEEFKKSAEASRNSIAMMGIHSLKGMMAYWSKDYQMAIEEINKGNPLDPLAKYYLGLAYQKAGQEEEAGRVFSEIAAFNRNSLAYSLALPAVKAM